LGFKIKRVSNKFEQVEVRTSASENGPNEIVQSEKQEGKNTEPQEIWGPSSVPNIPNESSRVDRGKGRKNISGNNGGLVEWLKWQLTCLESISPEPKPQCHRKKKKKREEACQMCQNLLI
jgi:hypothetical protein